MKTEKQILTIRKKCTRLYNAAGLSLVCDYANKIGLNYSYCPQCESDTPIIESPTIKECAVCGGGK